MFRQIGIYNAYEFYCLFDKFVFAAGKFKIFACSQKFSLKLELREISISVSLYLFVQPAKAPGKIILKVVFVCSIRYFYGFEFYFDILAFIYPNIAERI